MTNSVKDSHIVVHKVRTNKERRMRKSGKL